MAKPVQLYESVPEGEQQLRSIWVTHIVTLEGANYYTYGLWRDEADPTGPRFEDQGEWESGRKYKEGHLVSVPAVVPLSDTQSITDTGPEYLCIVPHTSSEANKPGTAAGQEFWLQNRPGLYVTGSPPASAPTPSDPDEETVEPDYADGFSFAMDTVMPGTDSEETQPDRDGEYKFGKRDHNDVWSPVGGTLQNPTRIDYSEVSTIPEGGYGVVGIADNDADGNPLDYYFRASQANDRFYVKLANQWWIHYRMRIAPRPSVEAEGDSDRWVLNGLEILGHDVRGRPADGYIRSGRVTFHFERAAPSVVTPNDTDVPRVPTTGPPNACRNLQLERTYATGTNAAALIFDWNPPQGGDAPTSYQVRRRLGTTGDGGGGWVSAIASNIPGSRHQFLGLERDTAYVVGVRAQNDHGFGQWTYLDVRTAAS